MFNILYLTSSIYTDYPVCLLAGSDYEDEGVDLMPFFSPTSYNGYGESDKVSNV